ncbi:MAG: SpoVA/SpoVAEb family sporulation membrane protein [Ruminococcus sp.]|nr:SpoVA/SpoVAEb family sporulation membrane protein [Ruminococcus sp.]
MNISKDEYNEMVEPASKNSRWFVNLIKAYIIGGAICTLGEALCNWYQSLGVDERSASTWCSVTLIAISVILTSFGLYEKIAKHGGAGTLVPITGFANSVAAPAIEFKTEGYVLGVGAKIFSIAGPVILYSTSAGVLYGIIYYIFLR